MEIKNLYLESCIFHSRIDIEEGNFEYIFFFRSTFNGFVYINDMNYLEVLPRDLSIKELAFHSSKFEKDVTVTIENIQNFSSSNSSYNEVFNLNNSQKKKTKSNMVMLRMDGITQGNIVIEQIHADIVLNGINFGNIYFKDLDIEAIYMNDFQNSGVISFSDIGLGK